MNIGVYLKRINVLDHASRRVIKGIAANLLGKIWVLVVQLAAIPILTQHWGASGYGTWLMISTIPTYVALSNVGLGTAAGLEITRDTSLGMYEKALGIFQSIWALVCGILCVMLILSCIALMVAWTLKAISTLLLLSIFLMVMYSIGIVQMSLLNVVFRATKKYALGTALNDLMVPIEGCALILVALFGGDILHASLCVCVLRWIGLLFYYQVLKRSESWVEIGFRNATKEAIRRLARPSLAALSLTLSDSLGIQAVVLTLGWSAGPAVVAIFSATRFLSRMPLQFAGLVTRAAIPELSRAVVSKDIVLLRRLLKVNVFTALAVVSPFLLALFFAGPFLLAHLSKKSLNAPEYLFIFLGIASASNAVWNAMSSPLLASNRQAEYASIYMFFCFFVMLVPFINMVPMLSTAFASMVSELLMMFVIWRKLRYHTKRNWVLD